MGTDKSALYQPIWIERCVNERSWLKNFLARYFEKYKLTPKEYEDWLSSKFKSDLESEYKRS